MGSDIFEAVLVVALDTKLYSVMFCYPPDKTNSQIAKQAPMFCFPEQESFRTSILLLNYRETFCFTLTQSDGSKVFGYCRRYLTQGIATCICILTHISSYGMYCGLLNILENLTHQPDAYQVLATFLCTLEKTSAPAPGQQVAVKFQYPAPRVDTQSFKLKRSSGSSLLEDFVHFSGLFDGLGIKLVVTLWECLLRESRVVLCSRNLGKLTSSINTITSILNPLSWQHILIPVLPNSMLDYCTAPMPFLIGVLPSSLPKIQSLPLEEVYFFNLDDKTVSMMPNEPFLPKSLRSNLISSLERVFSKSQSKNQQNCRDINIARCFLVTLANLLDGYENYFVGQDYDTDAFIQSNPQTKRSKEMLVETQIWECFIETQRQLQRVGQRESCILNRVPEWKENEIPCFKCGENIANGDPFLHKGFPICTTCMKRKKKQITKDNVKQKFKLRKRANHKRTESGTLRSVQRRSSAELISVPTKSGNISGLKEHVENRTLRRVGVGYGSIKVTDSLRSASSPHELQHKLSTSEPVVLPAPPIRKRSLTATEGNCSPVNQIPLIRKHNAPGSPQRNRIGSPKPDTPRVVRCPGCGEVIRRSLDAVIIFAARRQWHPQCLRCTFCNRQFDISFNDYKIHNGRACHLRCVPATLPNKPKLSQ